jgi:elongation factor Ts
MAEKKAKTTKEVAGEAKAISIELIKKLKELSGVGLTDAKNALIEAKGDFDKALAAMRKKGLTKAEKRGDRETREGIVESYVHDGRLGAIVEVNCETSFVAKTDEFKTLAHNIAMQVASMNPQWVSEDEIPADKMKEAREEAEKSLTGKEPENRKEQIIASKVSKSFADRVLLNQSYIFDENKTVAEYIKDTIAKTGENITVKQFKRIELGVTE